MTYSFKNCRECSKKHEGLNCAIQNSFTETGNVTLHEGLGFDKELRSIRGSLKVEATKKLSWKNASKGGKCELSQIKNNPEYDDGIPEDIRKRIARVNDELKLRQESIDLLKGRLTKQITGIKETITKVLDKDTSLVE